MTIHTIEKKTLYSLIMAATALLISCGQKQSSLTDPDFDTNIYIPEYASGFTIMGADDKESVLITVKDPWQGSDSVTTKLLIVRNDEPVPDDFSGQVLHDSASRIVTMSSTHIAMLDAVDASDLVVGVSGLDYISNPHIQARRDDIGDIGYEGNINYELLIALNPDLVLLYGVNGASMMENKLKTLGIPFMYVGEYLEESPLGKAEWMVALAEVAGKRELGIKTFAEIPVRYHSLKQKATDGSTHTPSVMLGAPYGDSWFMPPVQSYTARLISDAGGNYIYQENTGNTSAPIDMEKAYVLTSQADMWLNTGSITSLDELKSVCPKFADTECFVKGRVYNNCRLNATGGNDYYESGVVHPDIILRDLISILHPELAADSLVYYTKLN